MIDPTAKRIRDRTLSEVRSIMTSHLGSDTALVMMGRGYGVHAREASEAGLAGLAGELNCKFKVVPVLWNNNPSIVVELTDIVPYVCDRCGGPTLYRTRVSTDQLVCESCYEDIEEEKAAKQTKDAGETP